MAKDRYTEERDKQEAAKRAELKELHDKAIEEALKMTEPPVLSEADIKEIDELRKTQHVPASDFDFVKTRGDDTPVIGGVDIPDHLLVDDDIYDDGSNDSVVSSGIKEYPIPPSDINPSGQLDE